MSIQEIFKNQKTAGHASYYETVKGHYGMVACPIKEAAEAGEKVLEDGGNAIDAIIAMQFALCSVEGMNTGIGAGGFILYYDSENNETKAIHGHTRAPAATTPEVFYNSEGNLMPFDERTMSPKSVGVPGVMKMMELALEKYGSMSLDRLIDPAIKLAEEEYRVNSLWDRTIDIFKERLGEEAKKVFVPNGEPLKEGDMVRQPDLAKALKAIKKEGFSSLYEGELADAIIDTLQKYGGIMTKEDLQNYEASIEEPFWSSYKGYDLAFPGPPNGGGIAVSQILKILEPFNISQYGVRSWEKYHLVAEATRLALADQQTYLGDPGFTDIPLEGLFNEEYLKERGNIINFDKRWEEINAGDPWNYQEGTPSQPVKKDNSKKGMDTTHFTVIDQWGNIASCTTSLERIFGCGIMVEGYGFLLNNDITDFNPEPGTANEPNSNKCAVSSKSPTIVYHEGKPFFTLGSPGGPTIVGSVAQVLLHVLDYQMDLKEAVAERRIFNNPDVSWEWEDGIEDEIMAKLRDLGYKLDQGFKEVAADNRLGDVQAILVDPSSGKLYGTNDAPRPGAAIGLKKPPEES